MKSNTDNLNTGYLNMGNLRILDLPYDILCIIASKLNIIDVIKLENLTKQEFNSSLITDIFHYNDFKTIPYKYHNKCNIVYKVEQKDLNKYNDVYGITCDKQVTNLRPLSNLYKINCSRSNVIDVSMLYNIRELSCNFTFISQIIGKNNYLDNLHTLNCYNSEISIIKNLKNLKVLNCSKTKVKDLSTLINLIELDCSYTNINNVDTLINLNVLICFSTEIKDISNLTKLQCYIH